LGLPEPGMRRAQPAAGLSVTVVAKSSADGLNPAKARLPRCGGGFGFLPPSADEALQGRILQNTNILF